MTPSSQPENREQPIMSNTKQQIEEMLNKVSEYNKLSGKGHGDLKDNCYICGISPSGLIEAIDRLVTKAYKKGFNAGSVKETLRHGEALKGVMEKFEQARGESQLNDKEK